MEQKNGNEVVKPNFFIVGAPKCGTTALYEYLLKHPEVYMPAKELYYFGDDFTFRSPRPSLAYYLSLFKNAPAAATCIGEASVWYLYSKTAAQAIKDFQPSAKIIIMLRNPVSMLYSLHSQQVYSGNETIANFEAALLAETARRQGNNIPPYIGCPYEALYYSQVGRYYEQVKRYLTVFGKEQVHIVLLNDFAKNTNQAYAEVLRFLEIDDTFTTDFTPVNTNKKIRNSLLRDFLKSRPPFLIKVSKVLLPSRKLRLWLQAKLWSINTQTTKRPPMEDATKRFLQQAHQQDIMQLQTLIQRDLSAWET